MSGLKVIITTCLLLLAIVRPTTMENKIIRLRAYQCHYQTNVLSLGWHPKLKESPVFNVLYFQEQTVSICRFMNGLFMLCEK